MEANPALDDHAMPVPFVGEVVVLKRDGIEFHVDNLPSLGGGKWVAQGVVYLSTVRLVFVPTTSSRASVTGPPLTAFDMPLLYIQGEKFNQPIFGANNISGRVLPVQSSDPSSGPSVQLPLNFVIYFMEGGVGTFLPLFGNLLHGLRVANPHVAFLDGARTPAETASREQQNVDPIPREMPAQVLRTMKSAFVDPQDPTVVYVEQPAAFSSSVRRLRGYQASES